MLDTLRRMFMPIPTLRITVGRQLVMDGHWLGDAAGFLDPLYSQGFDFVSYTCCGIFGILADALAGKDVSKDRRRYNELYHKQFHTWFESVYKDKYYYLGDLELMTIAFYLDISAYFMGPVRQAYSSHPQRYSQFPAPVRRAGRTVLRSLYALL